MYPQSGWKLSNIREVGQGKNKKRKARLKQNRVFHFNSAQGVPRKPSVSSVRQALPFRQNPRFLVEEAEAEELSSKESKKVVGVDLGIARLATLSDGRFLENPKPLECSLERVRVLQRTLSRKRFLFKNWLKTKTKLAKEHEHIKDFRRDSLNSGRYLQGVRRFGARALKRSGFDPKRNKKEEGASAVRFLFFRAVLEWEFRKRGKLVLPVPAYNTSRECFLCGGINKGLTLEDRVFLCPHCGFTLDRDLNASLVLLKRAGWVPPVVACFALYLLYPP